MTPRGKYRMLGLMSGTSLDGLDIACVEFVAGRRWSFRILEATTMKYSDKWISRLSAAHTLSAESLLSLHAEYGKYLGESSVAFMKRKGIRKIDGIASHGHTIFHQPDKGFTYQLGDGSAIHAATGLPVICDFRSLDVQLGGEGAPLVPVGDSVLFDEYDVCLNLGGIANLSAEINRRRRAFDICFCNMALNFLAREQGSFFDRDGKMASKGELVAELRNDLNSVYGSVRKKRKALGREFFESGIQPLLDRRTTPVADRLHTVCESIVDEIEIALPTMKRNALMLLTGGGARNSYLVELLRDRLVGRAKVVVPEAMIVDYKEALIFAFLGVLRMRGEVNVLSSVTRSRQDSCSGVLIGNN